jgi:hypothetical protein
VNLVEVVEPENAEPAQWARPPLALSGDGEMMIACRGSAVSTGSWSPCTTRPAPSALHAIYAEHEAQIVIE